MWRHLNSDSGFSTGKKPTRTRAPRAMPTCGVDAFAVTVWRHHAAARGLLPLGHALTFPRPYRRRRGAGRSTIHSRACRRGGWGAPLRAAPHQPPLRRARQNAGGSCRTYRSLCPVLKFRRHPARRWHHPHACGARQRGRLPLPRCKAALLPMVRGGGRPRKGKAAPALAGTGGLTTDWRSSNESIRQAPIRLHRSRL